MASTGISTSNALAVKQWKDQAFQEYLGLLPLTKYMGTDENALIQTSEELQKKKGDKLTFSLIYGLDGEGVQGTSTLEGNEEELLSYDCTVTVDKFRNAVRTAGEISEVRYPWEGGSWSKAKPALTAWLAHFTQNRAFKAMGAVGGTFYGSASTAQKNAWNVANADRVLYGATTANYNATHATALLNVDSTTDVLNTAHLSLLKRLAKLARPRIRPIAVPNGPATEVFVYFAHPYTVRDLKADSTWKDAQREAMPRGMDNPLFTGAVGMWDGIVVVETDKIALLDNVGNGSIDVAQNFLCGAQALLFAMGGSSGDRLNFVEESFDYGDKKGVAIEKIMEVQKAVFNGKDHGIVTSYVAGVAD